MLHLLVTGLLFAIRAMLDSSTVKLEKAEREAAEVTTHRQHVSELEAAATARASEVVALNEQNVELPRKVFSLELVRGEAKMQEEFKSIQDAAAQRLDERVAGLDGRIADVKRDMDDHLYPHMFTAIAGRRWVVGHGLRLVVYKCARSVECHTSIGKVISMAINKGIQEDLKAEIEHGKEGRSLDQIEAYDPETEAKYVAVVFEFENISFPLLDELEGLKDSSLALI
ncbi:hypothetical protein Tco_0889132, partial [Tanacetum coccineum]